MEFKELIPWKMGRRLPAKKEEEDPFTALQREMNNLFEHFFSGFGMKPFRGWREEAESYLPCCDITEDEKAVMVKVELPGMDEKDIEVSLTSDSLTIKGEKKVEKEDKDKNYYRMERSYGAFNRVIPLPVEIDTEKVEAKFRNGILTVNLPKTPEAQAKKKTIEIKAEK